jgi:dihydrodipicolinate synthase/N-acetylneuraminate lyase
LIYFAGSDHRVAEACLQGGAGSITAFANVFPDLVKAAQEAVWHGRGSADQQARLSAARRSIDGYPMQAAVKHAVHLLAGLPVTAVRPPQPELTEEERSSLAAALLANLPEWRPQATVQAQTAGFDKTG